MIKIYFDEHYIVLENILQVSKVAAEITGDAEPDDDDIDGGDEDGGEEAGDDDDDGFIEFISMDQKVGYLAPILRIFALLHSFTAMAMILGYYCLKVSSIHNSC